MVGGSGSDDSSSYTASVGSRDGSDEKANSNDAFFVKKAHRRSGRSNSSLSLNLERPAADKKARKAETKAANAARRAAKKETKLAWKSAAAEAPVRHAAAPSVFSL